MPSGAPGSSVPPTASRAPDLPLAHRARDLTRTAVPAPSMKSGVHLVSDETGDRALTGYVDRTIRTFHFPSPRTATATGYAWAVAPWG